jgi:hypothetical protein
MNRYLIICATLLAGCGQPRDIVVSPDLLQPEPGWTGPLPSTEGELIAACFAEKTGRELANEKLAAISQILAD